MIGRVIHEKYKITSLLARGGMGKVYKALQSPLDRVCAVKVLTPPQNESVDGQFHKRFFLEASIGARLTHPNTVTIFDYGVADDGVYFIAMEYLEGKTLSKVLREEGPFNEERTTHIARQICRSLREAHTLGVVHRDLKPANVYLLQHGDESDVVKVLDFGLVKNVEEGSEDLTQTGLFMGSPKYMSPEQVKGEHVDGRADVYALGVMMFEMLTGHVPFEKAKQLDTLLAHVHDPVPALKDKKADLEVSEAIEALITRCLQKNPADRPNGMEEVLASLKLTAGGANTFTRSASDVLRASASFTPQPQVSMNSLSGEIPAANPTSIMPAAQQKQGRAKFFFAAAAALVLVVGIGVATRSPKPVETPATQPAAPKAEAPAPKASAAPVVTETAAPAPKVEEHFVEVESEPPGARVRDEAKVILCDKTPCKVRVDAPIVVVVEQDGYGDQKVKLAQNDAKHLVKLTKSAVWHPPAQAAAKPASPAAPTNTNFKPDPYGSGPY
jgi:serine/threonine-protein kinase